MSILGFPNPVTETSARVVAGGVVTMATAGIEHLVAQFANGDRHARRDFFDLAHKLGVDVTTTVRQPEVRRSRKEIIAAMRARGIPVGRFSRRSSSTTSAAPTSRTHPACRCSI